MTAQELRDYILRRLGSPAINIDVTTDQLDDCIEEAYAKFCELHYDGTNEGFYILNVIAGTDEYVLPQTIKNVLTILPGTDFLNDENLLITEPMLLSSGEFYSSFDAIDMEMWRQQRSNISNYTERTIRFDFNAATKRLKIFQIPETTENVALHVYKTPDNPEEAYGDLWFKQYCIALAGIQWAVNISKFEGATLPGGVTLNYQGIETRYTDQKEKLLEELELTYSEPVDLMWG